jgi:hypothetical protein
MGFDDGSQSITAGKRERSRQDRLGMRVNAQAFFSFCAAHVPLLRHLAERTGELSEGDVMRLVREQADAHEELPETTWRRLREYQILVPSEPGGQSYLVAEPVARLLTYLYNHANPATPEMIRGYVQSLDTLAKQLARALESENVTVVALAFNEISLTLRRIHADLDETHQAILAEVGRYKTERQRVPVREKFRRIVYWMERYVEPMIEIVRADGPLRESFDEVDRLLRGAREEALFNDHPALERNLRFLRIVGAHALRVFIQCRKEIQPLYESLRRSTFIAEGASRALEKLQNEGLANWGAAPLIGICSLRFQNVPGDAAIALALRRVFEHPPEPPPVLDLTTEEAVPEELVRRVWLDSLPDQVRLELPLPDLLDWMVKRHPEKDTSAVLAGFTTLVFHDQFQARFTETQINEYPTANGAIQGSPVQLNVP